MGWKPEWSQFCQMERSPDGGSFELRVEVPSPTGDPRRAIVFFVSDGDPSIAFGHWHSHSVATLGTDDGYQEMDLLEAADLILRGDIVCFYEIKAEPTFGGILDLRRNDEILDLLTDPCASGPVDILSWDGTKDRRVCLGSYL